MKCRWLPARSAQHKAHLPSKVLLVSSVGPLKSWGIHVLWGVFSYSIIIIFFFFLLLLILGVGGGGERRALRIKIQHMPFLCRL